MLYIGILFTKIGISIPFATNPHRDLAIHSSRQLLQSFNIIFKANDVRCIRSVRLHFFKTAENKILDSTGRSRMINSTAFDFCEELLEARDH